MKKKKWWPTYRPENARARAVAQALDFDRVCTQTLDVGLRALPLPKPVEPEAPVRYPTMAGFRWKP